ncbi:Alpha/Beta hydrolase protein [Apiosordaria backusii]|uniref:Alpha/Beta hydrolase protein n=1 Tax=Apiosordaria backusii TaxID=314023 RepID=A0AA40BND6_9PEZI|nr:Alpha/Beta hydrolase protein [Apiosordaria backusii]
MAATTTVTVPHMGGIKVGYRLSSPSGSIDKNKPTVVLINSMCTTVSLFDQQFSSQELTSAVNLLAIEPLGHGSTFALKRESFTYWDTAEMALQVMDALKVEKAFAVGTSQGGWMVVRMALLAPGRILGLLPLGTSMDSESAESRSKGGWDPASVLSPWLEKWTSATPTPDFVVDEQWRGMVTALGFGAAPKPELLRFWDETLKQVYVGDEGRKKVKMALINLLERDGLLRRLGYVKCPVYWLQGEQDPVFGSVLPAEHIKLFTSAPEATLTFVPEGGHFLNATSPREVEEALLRMVSKYSA